MMVVSLSLTSSNYTLYGTSKIPYSGEVSELYGASTRP